MAVAPFTSCLTSQPGINPQSWTEYKLDHTSVSEKAIKDFFASIRAQQVCSTMLAYSETALKRLCRLRKLLCSAVEVSTYFSSLEIRPIRDPPAKDMLNFQFNY